MGVFEHPEHRWIDATAGLGASQLHQRQKTKKLSYRVRAT